MQLVRLLSVLALTAALNACSSGIEQPRGNSKGYSSARLVRRAPGATIDDAKERKAHNMIQNSIATQFTSRGLAFNQSDADLIVAYLVIYQDRAMTTYYDDFFGASETAEEISDLAHKRGVTDGERREYFERTGLVIDVTDARTNKLVYRNVWKGDLVRGVTDATRAQRINTAVNEALSPFFK